MSLGSGIRKKPIPDPGVKKAPDPGSGSATLVKTLFLTRFRTYTIALPPQQKPRRGGDPQTAKHLPQSPFIGKFFG
jgi:hypothetical protein